MEQIIPEDAVARRHTVATMCEAWRESEKGIREAHRLLSEAEARLRECFDSASAHMRIDYDDLRLENPDSLLADLRRKAWDTLIEKINIKKVMSLSKQKEVEEQLKQGELPEINEVNVLAMMESNYNNMSAYAEQLIKEVYEWIKPRVHENPRWSARHDYKTNIKSAAAGLGEKVIIGWAVERGYSRNSDCPWRINYNRQDNFTALDNVFHILDGKGVVKSHHGPLFDAVAAAPRNGRCETDYFRVWMFSNRNMHLQFKRDDLLARFNAVAGGERLTDVKSP